MTTPVQPYEVLTYVDADGDRPFAMWLSTIPAGMKGRFLAVIDSLAKAPPHRSSGDGAREAMHGEMAGWHEVRQRGGRMLYRAFCLLESTTTPDRPSLVVVAGMTKPTGTTFGPRDYAAVRARGSGTGPPLHDPRTDLSAGCRLAVTHGDRLEVGALPLCHRDESNTQTQGCGDLADGGDSRVAMT